MPPKAKFSKNEIVETAFELVREQGIGALTARALAAKLGSSPRPIFTVFLNMEEVQLAVMDAAKALYKSYIEKGLSEIQPFKGVGSQYILFAINESKLFQLLFMKEQINIPNFSEALPSIDDNYEIILLSIQKIYGINQISAKKLYQHLWIYTHGIATLCATKMCRFTGEEVSEIITEVCRSILTKLNEEK